MEKTNRSCKRHREDDGDIGKDKAVNKRSCSLASNDEFASQSQPGTSVSTHATDDHDLVTSSEGNARSCSWQDQDSSSSSHSSWVEIKRDYMDEAFNNDEVLKTIFTWLPPAELLGCSLVNRIWNINSRYVLRNSKNCTAIIQSSNSKICEELKRFNAFLSHSSSKLPYNGLSIIAQEHNLRDKCVLLPIDVTTYEGKDVTFLYSSLFTKMKIKYLKILHCKLLGGRAECPVVKFLSSVLMDGQVNQHLLELSITNLPHEFTQFSSLGSIFGSKFSIKENIWPNLNSLEVSRLRIGRDKDKVNPSILNELTFLAAPQLKHLSGYMSAENLECIFNHGKIEAVRNFAFYPSELSEEKLNFVLKFTQGRQRLKELVIFSMSPFSQRILSDMMMRGCKLSVQLLTGSMSSLAKLEIGHLDLIQLIRLRLLSNLTLSSLSHLLIKYDTSIDKCDHLGEYFTLSRIDYKTFFPKLDHLQLCGVHFSSQDCVVMQGFWEDQNSTCNFVSDSVTKLSFCDVSIKFVSFYIRRMSQMFSNVKSLYVDSMNFEKDVTLQEEFSSHLWMAWPNLEYLTLSYYGLNTATVGYEISNQGGRRVPLGWRSVNLDSCFNGIPLDLVEKESTNGSDYNLLGISQLLPTYPSISALKCLKRLRLQIKHLSKCKQNLALEQNSYSNAFLSTRTVHSTFEKLPNLSVEISRNVCSQPNCVFSLDHLKPYFKFVNRTFGLADT